MDDQANGVYTFDIDMIPDIRVGHENNAWKASYTTDYYLANYQNMPYFQAEAATTALGEAEAEVVMSIINTYAQADPPRPNPFDDCDYIFFIHGEHWWDSYQGIALTGLTEDYWGTVSSKIRGWL